jgi:uncharacterized protein (TIGR03435 family)
MRHAAIALLLLLAQAPVKPAFEVATIKRNISGDGGSIGIEPGGRFRAINADVRFMIAAMYRTAGGPRLFPSQIVGLPDWASTEKYDMVGKVANEFAGLSAAEQFRRMPPMVQSLLEDRFKLRLHRETRQMPIYALVVARPNVIRPSAVDCRKDPDKCSIQSAGGHYSAVGLTMNNFMIFLSSAVERVVIDRTGLLAAYDVEFDWSSEPGSDKTSIFTAVQEQLGLKLESDRGPVDVVVIDHIERPTED